MKQQYLHITGYVRDLRFCGFSPFLARVFGEKWCGFSVLPFSAISGFRQMFTRFFGFFKRMLWFFGVCVSHGFRLPPPISVYLLMRIYEWIATFYRRLIATNRCFLNPIRVGLFYVRPLVFSQRLVRFTPNLVHN